jgi:hypothetical protein
MTNEEIKQRIQRILKENLSITQHGYMNGLADLEGIEDAAKAIATFYEQSILPEVLKEKDEKIKTAELGRKEYFRLHNTALERVQELTSQLSQLQSKMEEEKTELLMFLIKYGFQYTLRGWKQKDFDQHYTFDELLAEFKKESSTQSTESGNPNKQ